MAKLKPKKGMFMLLQRCRICKKKINYDSGHLVLHPFYGIALSKPVPTCKCYEEKPFFELLLDIIPKNQIRRLQKKRDEAMR